VADLVWILPLLPLVGAVFLLLGGRFVGVRAGWIATAAVFGSFVAAVLVFLDLVSRPAEERSVVVHLFDWLHVGDLRIDAALLADPLSTTMALFITGIGGLIHLYAIGYMHGDPRFPKFFAYLNLFIFSMLVLVLGENMLVTFLGWEGVGVCSYFLISFWHERPSAATAGKKAFVTNRIGDVGLMLAMFVGLAGTTATAVALLAFVGAVGKSAQLPLYVWLPDAMEGPTPVSALIHAATMVTSGVFLLTRLAPVLHAASPWASDVIAIVGAATALFAATIALAQHDIKKVLAYSTVSQLGFMFLAIGSGAFVAAIFHMVTHAFFKALLFLGSGSVIHGMHHEQDMRRMGALRRAMPVTAGVFIVGWLAIAGVPPFAGFWSKDEILLYVLADNPVLYGVGLLTAMLTALYMTRQVVMVFFGEARWHDASADHGAHGDHAPHESPFVMLAPLLVLAGLSIAGGAMQLPFSKDLHFLERWLHPVIEEAEADISGTWAYSNKWLLAGVAVAAGLVGIAWSLLTYARRVIPAFEPELLQRGWRYDEGISRAVAGPGAAAFRGVAWFDSRVVDGAVNGAATLVRGSASALRSVQGGLVRVYASVVAVGAVAVTAWFVLRSLLG
jgi:NADH-quinone oxidoreductase subunit L